MNNYEEMAKEYGLKETEIREAFVLFAQFKSMGNTNLKEIVDKAKQYGNISKELGCPLEVVMKALKNGAVYNKYSKFKHLSIRYDYITGFYLTNGIYNFYLKDYKKTWWLKVEKSE